MALMGDRTFVGFGFGAIQAGLFLHEAFLSGAFRRLVVAEVVPEVVAALRRSGGFYSVNIAHPNRVETATVGPIEPEDPADPASRARLVSAVAAALEIATAVPSVRHYRGDSAASLHLVLAEGLARKVREDAGPVVVYAAENHNRAAEILRETVLAEVPSGLRDSVDRRVRFLDTVIGKMSGVVTDSAEVRARGLSPVTRGEPRAFLVEAFNRILISAVRFDDPAEAAAFRRGITVFDEKSDLLPFEEAKLFGHNATHATAGYLSARAGLARMAQVRGLPGLLAFLRAAFVEESGAALVQRHRGVDPLFTPEGYAAYADDLLARMTNPHLGDTVDRVCRDVRRKLGWDDRLVGTMRAALAEGIVPLRYAVGGAAALAHLDPSLADADKPLGPALVEVWGEAPPRAEAERVVRLIEDGRRVLARWAAARFGDVEAVMREARASSTM